VRIALQTGLYTELAAALLLPWVKIHMCWDPGKLDWLSSLKQEEVPLG
jgi:hypothetical protein